MKQIFTAMAAVILVGVLFNNPARAADSVATKPTAYHKATYPQPKIFPGEEKHFGKITQLTFGGENAEAYWSSDGKQLIFQSTRPPYECDQIFTMNADGTGEPKLVSTGKGKCTCAYFVPNSDQIVYASTHEKGDPCPSMPPRSREYTWVLHPEFDIFRANRDGTNPVNITNHWGYDAEAIVNPKGDRIIYCSVENGDANLYTMNLDGSDRKQLTDRKGYDGGPWWSPDGKKIVWRADYPKTALDSAHWDSLLAQNLIRPSKLDVWMMNADGTGKKQLTHSRGANFAPVWLPDNRHILFVSNLSDGKGRDFDIYKIDTESPKEPEKITQYNSFDGFPMPSPDGKRLVFCSNRNGSHPNETNVFVVEWKD